MPCVYVRFPPRPVPANIADSYEHCFPNPIEAALFGHQRGYKARECKAPPNICREFDWFTEKRKEERTGNWSWFNGPNIFQGDGDKLPHKACKLDSDCKGYPDTRCFGNDVHSSICESVTGRRLGESCNFDEQCTLNQKQVTCDVVKIGLGATKEDTCDLADLTYETICHNYICTARVNCGKSILGICLPFWRVFGLRISIELSLFPIQRQ